VWNAKRREFQHRPFVLVKAFPTDCPKQAGKLVWGVGGVQHVTMLQGKGVNDGSVLSPLDGCVHQAGKIISLSPKISQAFFSAFLAREMHQKEHFA
jgi:hypothetical protein